MKHLLAAAVMLAIVPAASAQYLMMPDSTNNRVVLFDPFNGSVVNPNYFALAAGTPIHAMQVGNEIWVSEQIGDRISRWDLNGNSLGAITGGMDNLRGMEIIGSTVYLCNDGTAGGAPGAAILRYDFAGNSLGSFAATSSSPFAILEYQGNMLVASDVANDDIHQYTTAGASVGTFHNSTSLNFAEQMNYDSAGNILVAGFSSNNVVTLNFNTGAVMSSFSAPGARGVYQLGNGNVLWSSGSGVFVHNVSTGVNSQVYTGGGRFFDFVLIPGPGALGLFGLACLVGSRRRRD